MARRFFLVCLDDFYHQNRIFQLDNPVNRDNYYYPYHFLRERLRERGITLDTIDHLTGDPTDEDALIFFDLGPKTGEIVRKYPNVQKYLYILETECVNPRSWDRAWHPYFSKVFTWHDDWVDGKQYRKVFLPCEMHHEIPKDMALKNRLCVMIAGRKNIRHPLVLYGERLQTLRWFERNHLQDLDLYGMGWGDFYLGGRRISRHPWAKALVRRLKLFPSSYRGVAVSKQETMRPYRFAFCYEMARDIPGYISEKIFDCFFAGCVPVYWGAPNVSDFIPADTFIDRRRFASHEELYMYLKNMDNGTYLRYLEAIQKFLNSAEAYPFSAEGFLDHFCREILEIT